MKKKPNLKPTIDDVCAICGVPYAHSHEVFFGNPNAALSQKWGMVIRLCQYHHQDHKAGVHHNKELDLQLKQEYQKRFEDEHGHDKFYEVFRKSWL